MRNELISEGWKKIKEPSNVNIAFLLSIPFMIINGIIFISIACHLYPPIAELLNNLNANDNFSIRIDKYKKEVLIKNFFFYEFFSSFD